MPWLAGAIVAGGIVGPILLMAGLARTNAGTAPLLLTLEGVATALMAWFIFHENFDRRVALGMACLVTVSPCLRGLVRQLCPALLGPLAIIGACAAWGLDNNLTRKVSLADPLQIVELKGIIAGPVNLALGFVAGGFLPNFSTACRSQELLGFWVMASAWRCLSRRCGIWGPPVPELTSRPRRFIGAVVAVLFLRDPVTLPAPDCRPADGLRCLAAPDRAA